MHFGNQLKKVNKEIKEKRGWYQYYSDHNKYSTIPWNMVNERPFLGMGIFNETVYLAKSNINVTF